MTGAEAAIGTAVGAGAELCFANPGTTEMDLVIALEAAPEMRTVLGLFEGVCSGMADGYGRMTGRPSLTLLHLGVGLSNAMANLHNARRARSPIVNLIGDHPEAHLSYDAPLTSDIAAMAKPVSQWLRTVSSAREAGKDMAAAMAAAQGGPGRIATLITPADTMREEAAGPVEALPIIGPASVDSGTVDAAAKVLSGDEPVALLLSGQGVREKGLAAAQRIASATNCEVLCDCFPAHFERGAGRPPADRLPYFPELVLERLKTFRFIILAGAPAPVSFFLYPQWPSSLVPEGCEVLTLATPEEDIVEALAAVADSLGAKTEAGERAPLKVPGPPSGELDTGTVAAAIASALPENAIVADESATSGGPTFFMTRTAAPHSVLYLTGGGIGMGLPLATGAAVACPDRSVIALLGDGGAMYTLQALWTQAREGLDVTNIIFSNRKYQILEVELARAGVDAPGDELKALLNLRNPDLDWVGLAKAMGVPGDRPAGAEAFYASLKKALSEPGPHLIEAVL